MRKRRGGARAAPVVPRGLNRHPMLLRPVGCLQSWEEGGRDTQAKGSHPGEEGAECGGAVLSRAGRRGGQDGSERRGGERRR